MDIRIIIILALMERHNLFDTTGKIIKTYAYGEVCPTEFFDGIAIKW